MSEALKKVGLIPATLMVAGNIMGSGVFMLPASLAGTCGMDAHRHDVCNRIAKVTGSSDPEVYECPPPKPTPPSGCSSRRS